MANDLKIGIAAIGGRWWLGGVVFVELLVKALAQLPPGERPRLQLIVNDTALADFDIFQPSARLADSVIYIGMQPELAKQVIGEQVSCCRSYAELFTITDIYFPVNSAVLPEQPAISWIPDFQHCYLPEFFSPGEIIQRDNRFQEIAAKAKMLVFSSQAVENDFRKFYPKATALTRVLSYQLMPEAEWYLGDPAAVSRKYQLPDRFILCCNQFWVHKNHKVLFEAIAHLRAQGRDIPVVCTGKTEDYRWPDYFAAMPEYIRVLGIEDLVCIVGLIPREDQVQLIRRCLCVVQPSLFEGLSLIVCEARALGKPILVSDIPVHREQQYGHYFDPGDAAMLAEALDGILAEAEPGPDSNREALARQDAQQAVNVFAKQFCAIAETAADLFGVKYHKEYQVMAQQAITVATSLMPGNTDIQKEAVNSWKRMGFEVISLNAADELEVIRPLFPEVKFVQVQRDARQKYGKPFIYLDDVLSCLMNCGSEICGIVNSDIHLRHDGLGRFIRQEAGESIIYGCRIDVDALDSSEGTVNIGGYDYFFFDRNIARCYPENDFCIGLPWWDYWAILYPLALGKQAKKITSPVAFHLRHATQWDGKSWLSLGQIFSKYVEVPFPVNNQTMIDLQRIVNYTIVKRSHEYLIGQ